MNTSSVIKVNYTGNIDYITQLLITGGNVTQKKKNLNSINLTKIWKSFL